MNATIRNISSILAFFLLTAGLGRLTYVLGMNVAPGLWLAYLGLLIFMTISGVYLAGGKVSLLPMMSVAGFLTMGLVPIMWAAYIAALVYGVIRYRFAERWGESFSSWQSVVTLTAINVVVQAGGIFVGGRVYLILGGEVPVTSFTWRSWEPFIALVLSSMSFNVLVIGTYIVSLKRETVASFLKQIPDLLRYEGIPMVLAPLTALIYTQLGWWQWVLFAAVLVGVSLVTQNLNQTSLRLERRLRELKSLQAVGQALSSTLDVDQVLRVIHQQVDKLITAHTFYVALYDERADEVSFPLAYEGGERVFWQSRQAGDGLTEYVLRTKQPLLIRDNVEETLRELGVLVMAHGKPAACWLGVPMMAGDEILGVMTLQSLDRPRVYDESHKQLLATIASQAAVAVQNASLYSRTDQALAQRVQELNSILDTIREGILLLDTAWNIVAANQALATFLEMEEGALRGSVLTLASSEGESVLAKLGYTREMLRDQCERLYEGEDMCRDEFVLEGEGARPMERMLAAVRAGDGEVNGWLLVFTDLSEEKALAALQDDMMHMLVHDLRSPLTAMMGSLKLLEKFTSPERAAERARLLGMAYNNSERMLAMVNQLLDISKLESGQMPIQAGEVAIEPLLTGVVGDLAGLAAEGEITVEVHVLPNLPALWVDEEHMRRVVNNLVDNAIKFTPDGGRIRLWGRWEQGRGRRQVLLGVEDTGHGIPADRQDKLFKKFEQVIAIEGRRAGTGLGLPYCKLVVEAHGGQIWVESEVGKGSTFIMRLPVVEEEKVA